MSSRGAAKKLPAGKPAKTPTKRAHAPAKAARSKPAAKVAHLPAPKPAAKKAAPTPAGRRTPAAAPARPALPAPRPPLAQRTPPPPRPAPGSAPAPAGGFAARPASGLRPAPVTPVLQLRKPQGSVPSPRPQLPPKQQTTLARSYFWSDLRVGDDLPTLTKPPIDRVQVARYAAAAGDFNRLHLDEPYATALGYRGAFAPGSLAMGFVAQLLTQWLRRGRVRKLSARFVKIVRPGDELTCRGRVAELRKEKSVCRAELEIWAENQKGELVLRGHATCELLESPSSLASETWLVQGGARPPSAAQRPPLPPLRKPMPPALRAPPKKK